MEQVEVKAAAFAQPLVKASVDPAVVALFDGAVWWEPVGAERWLHWYNLVRVPYIKTQVCRHFGRDAGRKDCLEGLRVLDIGCGGGVLCEPLARLDAKVVGADPAENAIRVACQHALKSALDIDYRAQTAETLLNEGEQFDVVLAMEVVEHVPDPEIFLACCSQLVAPGGVLIVSTINRTIKSYAYAIVVAQYLLRLLPPTAHEWRRFVTPGEIGDAVQRHGLRVTDVSGVTMNLRSCELQLSKDRAVNFMLAAARTPLSARTVMQ